MKYQKKIYKKYLNGNNRTTYLYTESFLLNDKLFSLKLQKKTGCTNFIYLISYFKEQNIVLNSYFLCK